jgi:hypothetical protein
LECMPHALRATRNADSQLKACQTGTKYGEFRECADVAELDTRFTNGDGSDAGVGAGVGLRLKEGGPAAV